MLMISSIVTGYDPSGELVEVAQSERTASHQLMFFVLGVNDTGSSLSLLNDTFVSKGCAPTGGAERPRDRGAKGLKGLSGRSY
jgi:hypothetical protein